MNLWLAQVRSARITANVLTVLDLPGSVVDLEILEQATIEVSNRQGTVRLQMPPTLRVRVQSKGNEQ